MAPFLLILLLLIKSSLATVNLYSDGNLLTSVDTHDWYDRATPFFNVTGVPIRVNFTRHKDPEWCEFDYIFPSSDTMAKAKEANVENTILVIDQKDSSNNCYLKQIGRAFMYVQNSSDIIEKQGLPLPSAYLMLLWSYGNMAEKFPGNPNFEEYAARRHKDHEYRPPPSMMIALMSQIDAGGFLDAVENATATGSLVTWNLVQQTGPWNKIAQSFWRKGTKYLVFGIDVIIALATIYQLAMGIRRKEVSLNLRYTIVLLALGSVILYTPTVLMPSRSVIVKVIKLCGSVMVHIAFYLLMYLLCNFIKQIENHWSIRIFQIILLVCGTLATIEFLFEVVWKLFPRSAFLSKGGKISRVADEIARIIVAFLFLLYSFYFVHKGTNTMTPSSKAAMIRLSILGVVTFLTFCALAAFAFMLDSGKFESPGANMTIKVLQQFFGVVRVTALLLVLGVKMPGGAASKAPELRTTKSTVSSSSVEKIKEAKETKA